MLTELLSSQQAACWLGISTATWYDWLSQSDAGTFAIRGQPVSINYYQGGRNGQGRIKIDRQELERLLGLMRVPAKSTLVRRPPTKKASFQHITAKLGRPGD